MARKYVGIQVCKYNIGCECENQECEKCGWYPPVANRRLRKFREGLGMFEKKYKIPFTGYCEIYAKSASDAAKKVDHDTMHYAEYNFGRPVCLTPEDDEDELD